MKQKLPNAWGLYDMLGNVSEWVADWYLAAYFGALPSPAIDPKGPPSAPGRVVRGGSWSYGSTYLRASLRGGYRPAAWDLVIGFRCVIP